MLQQKNNLLTKDILKIIPLPDDVRKRLLNDYPDNMDYDSAVRVEEIAWDMYYIMFELVYQKHIKKLVSEHMQVMNNELHDAALQLTKEELAHAGEHVLANDEISKLREEIVNLTPNTDT